MRCTECGDEPDDDAHAAGWIAFRVELRDDPDSPEVVCSCPVRAAREFGRR